MFPKKSLAINFLGLNLKNPLLGFTGCFEATEPWFDFKKNTSWDINLLGGIVWKSLTYDMVFGNPMPHLKDANVANSFFNSVGLKSLGLQAFANEIVPIMQNKYPEQFLIVSVWAPDIKSFVKLCQAVSTLTFVKAIELNVSCPNVASKNYTPTTLSRLLNQVAQHLVVKKPLIVKLNPFCNGEKDQCCGFLKMVKAAEKAGAAAITLINAIPSLCIDIYKNCSVFKNMIVGYSGSAIKPIALKYVYQARQVTNLPIIGSGGIFTWEDVVAFLLVGASCVLLSSSLIKADQHFLNNLLIGLQNYCDLYQMDLASLIGTLAN